jgi:hypothetical protein
MSTIIQSQSLTNESCLTEPNFDDEYLGYKLWIASCGGQTSGWREVAGSRRLCFRISLFSSKTQVEELSSLRWATVLEFFL